MFVRCFSKTVFAFAILASVGAFAQFNESCTFPTTTTVPKQYSWGCASAHNNVSQTLTGGGVRTSGPFTMTAPTSVPTGGSFGVNVTFNPSASGTYSGTAQWPYGGFTLTASVTATYNGFVTGFVNPKYVVVGVTYPRRGPVAT